MKNRNETRKLIEKYPNHTELHQKAPLVECPVLEGASGPLTALIHFLQLSTPHTTTRLIKPIRAVLALEIFSTLTKQLPDKYNRSFELENLRKKMLYTKPLLTITFTLNR